MFTVATANESVNAWEAGGRVSDPYRQRRYRLYVRDPGLDKALMARFVARQVELERDAPKATGDEPVSLRVMAERYGVSHPMIYQAIKAGRAIDKLVLAYAAKHYDGSFDRLRDATKAWAAENSVVVNPVSDKTWLNDLPIPRMRPALEMALDEGAPIEVVEEFALREWPRGSEQIAASGWWLRLQLELQEHARSREKRPGTGGTPKNDTPIPPSRETRTKGRKKLDESGT